MSFFLVVLTLPSPEPEKTNRIPLVVGLVTSTFCLTFLVMGVIIWRRFSSDKNTRERGAPENNFMI